MNIPYVMKRCSKCGEWLVASSVNFHKGKKEKYGLKAECKKCRAERSKKYREANKESIAECNKKYRETHKEAIAKYSKAYSRKRREKKLEEYFIEQRRKELEEKKAKEKDAEAKVTVTEKRCSKCGRILPAEAFYKQKTTKDGLRPYCKECQKEYAKERYYEHIEKYGW